jgi:uncharacterized protein
MIGISVALYLLVSGRMSGISGIVDGAMRPGSSGTAGADWARSVAYIAGLPIGALVVGLVAPSLVPQVSLNASTAVVIGAGLLAGIGTRLANGCTSGHGVCGLPRFSIRSIVATATFMGAAAVVVFVTRHLF